MPEFSDITYTVDDPCAVIRLNRPETLNAFTLHTLGEIRRAVDLATRDRRVVGIVIGGEGRAFSAGLDMSTLAETTQSAPAATAGDRLPGIFSYLMEVPKPVIAAVNGVAAGGGFVLAMMCDRRILARSARLTTVFLKRGLIAEHGTSWLLPRMVGVSRALDLLWASDKVSAEEALEMGLADEVVEDGTTYDAARGYIEKLAATVAPKAIAASKRLVYTHLGANYVDALREAEAMQNEFVTAPDAVEGARAFVEKRTPSFERLGDG